MSGTSANAKVNKSSKAQPRQRKPSTNSKAKSSAGSTTGNSAGDSSPSANLQQLTRLDAYLPALNTGHMDGKIQDVVIKHPLVRSLIVPECDLEARRRCIALITRILESATPILPLLLSNQSAGDSAAVNKLRQEASMAMGAASNSASLPNLQLAPEARHRLISMIMNLSERDHILKFWFNHYSENAADSSAAGGPNGNPLMMSPTLSEKKSEESTLQLYLRVKSGKDNLADLADRIQGAVCKAFWETWDDIFITLADIVGCGELQATDNGRMFRPCGDAAIYINNYKVTKKREMEEQKRKSFLASQHDQGRSMSMSMGGGFGQQQHQPPHHLQHQYPPHPMSAYGPQSGLGPSPSNTMGMPTLYNPHEYLDSSLTSSTTTTTTNNNNNNNNKQHRNNSIISATSPLDTRSSVSNSRPNPLVECFGTYDQRYPVSPPKSNGSPDSFGDDTDTLATGMNGNSNRHPSHPGLPLMADDGFLMPEFCQDQSQAYSSNTSGNNSLRQPHQQHGLSHQQIASLSLHSTPDEQLFGNFTTLEDGTSQQHQRQSMMANSGASASPHQHVDLRQRIKMMEEGKPDVVSPNSSVVW